MMDTAGFQQRRIHIADIGRSPQPKATGLS